MGWVPATGCCLKKMQSPFSIENILLFKAFQYYTACSENHLRIYAYQIQGSRLHPASLGHTLKNKVQYISQSSINRRTLTGVTPKWLKCLGWVIFGW